jgi:hypothetical protein
MARDDTVMESRKEGIERIEGRCGILLIAPHGFRGDDDNTGTLTRKVAQRLGCYAIINEVYQKPEKRRDPKSGLMREVPDIARRRINLNRFSQVEEFAKEEFLVPVLEYTERIIKDHGIAYVLWIHGIKDRNIAENAVDANAGDVHVVLGIGQGNRRGFTADGSAVAGLIKCFKDNGVTPINAALAKKESSYSGSHENIMNQVFIRKHYGLSKVQSIQLEVKYTGFRDPHAIETSARAFSSALSRFITPRSSRAASGTARYPVPVAAQG